MLKNTLLIIFSFVLALFIGEIALRVAEPELAKIVIPDDILGHRISGGTDWDKNGFRNNAVLRGADIVTLGDSMTEGQNAQKEDSWPLYLGKVSSTTVYNMGVGGYGPVQYSALLPQALEFKPKYIIVGFFMGNDLYDAYDLAYHHDHWKDLRDPNATIEDKPLVDNETRLAVIVGEEPGTLAYRMHEIRLWIRGNSQLYARLGDATRQLRVKFGFAPSEIEKLEQIAALGEKNPDMAYVFNKENPERATILSPFYRYDAVNLEDPRTKEGWRITQKLFRDMIADMRKQGVEPVFAVIPMKEIIYLQYMRRQQMEIPEQFLPLEEKNAELEKRFAEFCEEEKVRCINTIEGPIRALEKGEKLFGPVLDGHPYAAGYHAIAEEVYDYMLNSRLLPIAQLP